MLTQFSDTDTDSNTPASSHGTDSLITDSLKKLQSANERRLLDVVDKLRRTGLNGIIELPQLVVCGDQSSGKSSVLEAVSIRPQKGECKAKFSRPRSPKSLFRGKPAFVLALRLRLYCGVVLLVLLLSRSILVNCARRPSRPNCPCLVRQSRI